MINQNRVKTKLGVLHIVIQVKIRRKERQTLNAKLSEIECTCNTTEHQK